MFICSDFAIVDEGTFFICWALILTKLKDNGGEAVDTLKSWCYQCPNSFVMTDSRPASHGGSWTCLVHGQGWDIILTLLNLCDIYKNLCKNENISNIGTGAMKQGWGLNKYEGECAMATFPDSALCLRVNHQKIFIDLDIV